MELYPIRFWCLQACCRGSFSRAFSARPPTVSSATAIDRKSTRLNSSHSQISYAVFCLKKKNYKSTSLNQTRPIATRPSPASLPLEARTKLRGDTDGHYSGLYTQYRQASVCTHSIIAS